MIDHVIEALNLDARRDSEKWTPAEETLIIKNGEGSEVEGNFNYASVVGMLLYLSSHTCLDITYEVNCCSQYIGKPKLSQEKAFK